MTKTTASLLLLASLCGCSASDFQVAQPAAGGDGGARADGNPPFDPDATTNDTGGKTDADVRLDGGCEAVGPDPTDVWVDAKATGPSQGTASCPYRTIAEALKALKDLSLKPRTIHVRSGTYREPNAIEVRAQVTLKGEGTRPVLRGGGSCGSSTECVVLVQPGGVVDGVEVDAEGARSAIVTGTGAGPVPPKVQRTHAFDAYADGNAGVLVLQGASLGPDLDASGNVNGVQIRGTALVELIGPDTVVRDNKGIGIDLQARAPLVVSGTKVLGNVGGLRAAFDASAAAATKVTVRNAAFTDNGPFGISANGEVSLTLRNTVVTGNGVGVQASYGARNDFDFGQGEADRGGNTFGGTTAKNTYAGICVVVTRSTSLPAYGNRFSTCGPLTKILAATATCAGLEGYADIWFRGATAPATDACETGP